MQVITWAIALFSGWTLAQQFINVDDQIYYKEPEIPLRGFNFTIGGNRPVSGPNDNGKNLAALVAATALCQTILVNKGLSNVKLDGQLFLSLNDYNTDIQTSQNSQMSIYERSLYNKTTNQPLNARIQQIDSYFGYDGEGNCRINAALSGASGIPYIVTGSFAGSNSDDDENILYFNNYVNQTLFAIQASMNITIFEAVVSFLKFMNWTLVGTIYESTIFGFTNEQRTKIYQNSYQQPYFACAALFNGVVRPYASLERGQDFCSCIESYDSISVIVLFATINNAYIIAENIARTCSNRKFTYIVCAENSYTPFSIRADSNTPLTNGFFIRGLYDWDYRDFMASCYDAAGPEEAALIHDANEDFFSFFANCSSGISNLEDKPVCSMKDSENVGPCVCSDEVFSSQTLSLPQLFYVADGILTLAKALSLLQNNCSYLNAMQSAYVPRSPAVDFCTIDKINSTSLNYALRVVNFTGHTGEVSFASKARIRLVREFYAYQISENVLNGTFIGNYSIYGANYDSSLISFPEGNVPFSAIEVNEPSLDDGVVAVFFGISIFFIAAFAVIFIVLWMHRRNPVLRRNSFALTEIMCVGVLLHAVEMMFNCFGVSGALCWINLFISTFAFCFYIGGLIAKNIRIYRIFTHEGATALKIETWKLLLMVAILLVYFLLLQLLVLLDGFGAKVKQAEDNPFYLYWDCMSDTNALTITFAIIYNASRVIILICASVLSLLIRHVHSFYNESTAIAVIAYTYLMTFILLISLNYLLKESTDSEILMFVTRSEQLVIICTIALFVYFLPLLWKVLLHEQSSRSRRVE